MLEAKGESNEVSPEERVNPRDFVEQPFVAAAEATTQAAKKTKEAAKQVSIEVEALRNDVHTDIKRRIRHRSTIRDYIRLQHRLHPAQAQVQPKVGFANLTEEIGDYLMSAITIYGFADMRALLRGGHIALSDSAIEWALRLPAGRKQLIKLFLENEEMLRAAKMDTSLYMAVLENFDKNSIQEVQSARESIYERDQSSLLIFDDENSAKELVYGIAVNRARREIRVTFRGSVSARDWSVNTDSFMITVPNPLNGKNTAIPQAKCIGFHRGFYSYLMGHRTKQNRSKFETILEHIRRLLDQYPGFEIQVSGHSLGAVLATLFAFMLACEDIIPAPVRVISFASPRLGNIQFARAFQELEVQGRIYHLRVVNHRDLVTTVPDRLSCFTFWMQEGIYRHVGTELRLFLDSKKPRIKFPVVHFSRLHLMVDDCTISVSHTLSRAVGLTCGCFLEDYVRWHSCNEYMQRILRKDAEMDHLTLDVIHKIYVGEIQKT